MAGVYLLETDIVKVLLALLVGVAVNARQRKLSSGRTIGARGNTIALTEQLYHSLYDALFIKWA